jgi:hypothetical protein
VHPSVLLRRSALEAVGGWQEHGWPEDYDLWLRLVLAGHRLGKVAAPLLLWRDHPRRLTRTDPRYSRLAFLCAKARYLARGFLAGAPAVVIWGAGRVGGQLSRLLQEQGVATRAFVDIDPAAYRGRLRRGRPVVPPEGLDAHRGLPVLAAVGTRGARRRIRAHLADLGLREGRDFIAVA